MGAPYRVDIGKANKDRHNAREMRVVNTRVNRLIDDRQPDAALNDCTRSLAKMVGKDCTGVAAPDRGKMPLLLP